MGGKILRLPNGKKISLVPPKTRPHVSGDDDGMITRQERENPSPWLGPHDDEDDEDT